MHSKTIETCLFTLINLRDKILSKGYPWIEPHISNDYDDDGELSVIVFEWGLGKEKQITFFIEKEKIEYLQSWGKSILTEMKDGVVSSIDEMFDLYKWMVNK